MPISCDNNHYAIVVSMEIIVTFHSQSTSRKLTNKKRKSIISNNDWGMLIVQMLSNNLASPPDGIQCQHWDDEWKPASWPTLLCTCVEVIGRTSFSSSSLLLQSCPEYLVCLYGMGLHDRSKIAGQLLFPGFVHNSTQHSCVIPI